MDTELEEKIKRLAITSRLILFLIQLVSNSLFPDHNAKVFKKPLITQGTGVDKFIALLFDGYSRWDGQYFLHITEYGYTYENTTAFFPMFPFVARYLGFLLHAISPVKISMHSAILISAVLVNNCVFIASSVVLFRLSLLVLKNEKMAYVAGMLFCVNPASIFFSAVYSESLYFFLSISAMLQIERGSVFWGSLLVGLSGVTRSNGILNTGYLAYRCLRTWRGGASVFFKIFNAFLLFFFAFIFFSIYQGFCYFTFCFEFVPHLPPIIVHQAKINDFILPGNGPSPWCKSSFPLAYSYVQKHYWDVGFLRYFQVKQIPNFILAFPVTFIIGLGTYRFCSKQKKFLKYIGFVKGCASSIPVNCFPYILHTFFLTVFSLFCAHVQITTRLICSSGPVLYWFVASSLIESGTNLSKDMWKKSILSQQHTGEAAIFRYYFFAYFLAGTFAFSNNLPWT